MNRARLVTQKDSPTGKWAYTVLEWNGKNMTPTMIPINQDGSFTYNRSLMGLETDYRDRTIDDHIDDLEDLGVI
jgi:hypothetical protein